MSHFLELPDFDQGMDFRTFANDGLTIVYPHFHKEIEVIYALRGSVNIGVGDQTIQLAEGEVYYFSSGEAHFFLASPDSERLVYQFDLKIFDEVALGKRERSLFELFEQGEPHSRNWPEDFRQRFIDYLLQLYATYLEETPGRDFRVMGLLHLLVGDMYRDIPQRQEQKAVQKPEAVKYQETLEQLNLVFDYIENHYAEQLTLDQVAAVVGYTPYYFTRFFKKNTGQTFIQFLTEYRIMQAKFILANEKLPMVDVAEKAGFASVKTFHHVFKQAVGVSPLKYQKEQKKSY